MNGLSRLVTGLAAPWDVRGKQSLRFWQFRPDSLTWSGPIRALRDHDNAQRVGLVVSILGDARGLRVCVHVRPGRAGDAALAVVDGGGALSAGLEDIEAHVGPDGNTMIVTSARLAEVSIVDAGAMPGTRAVRGEV